MVDHPEETARAKEAQRLRRQRVAAQWFLVWGAFAAAFATMLVMAVFRMEPAAVDAARTCTGPLGYAFDIGPKYFGFLISVGLVWSALMHFIAGARHLISGAPNLAIFVSATDALLWVAAALTMGTGMGFALLALPVVLAAAHGGAVVPFIGPEPPPDLGWVSARNRAA